MVNDLKKKVVLITGAGKGIGYELVKSCLKNGAYVYAVTRTKGDLSKFSKEKNISIFYGDVSNKKLINKIFLKSIKSKIYINSLINNAGIRQRKKFLDISEKNLSDVFKTNFFSVFKIIQIFATY